MTTFNRTQQKRFAELRTAQEVWGTHEITEEPVLVKYVHFQCGHTPAWTLIDFTGSKAKTGTYLGRHAVDALAALERMQPSQHAA